MAYIFHFIFSTIVISIISILWVYAVIFLTPKLVPWYLASLLMFLKTLALQYFVYLFP